MQNSPNQPNQNPNQSVIDRGKPEDTEDVFFVKEENVQFPRGSMKKFCTKNLVLQIDRGNA